MAIRLTPLTNPTQFLAIRGFTSGGRSIAGNPQITPTGEHPVTDTATATDEADAANDDDRFEAIVEDGQPTAGERYRFSDGEGPSFEVVIDAIEAKNEDGGQVYKIVGHRV